MASPLTPALPTEEDVDDIDRAVLKGMQRAQEAVESTAHPQGGNEGLLPQVGQAMINAPGQVIGGLVDLIEDLPVFGGLGFPPMNRGLGKALTRALTPPQFVGPPATQAEQLGARTGLEIGANLPLSFFGPGGLALAARLAREAVVSSAAGMTAGVAQQATKGTEFELPAEVTAQIGVHGAGAIGSHRLARGLTQAQKVLPPLREGAITTQIQRGVAENIADPIDVVRANLASAEQAQRDIPDFTVPGLGTGSGDPGLLGVETAMRRESPQVEAGFRSRIGRSAEAVRQAVIELEPPGVASADAIPAALLRREAEFANTVERAKRQINTGLLRSDEALNEALTAQNTRTRNSAGLRTAVEIRRAFASAKSASDALYGPVNKIDTMPVTGVNVTDLRAKFNKIKEEFGVGEADDNFPTYAARKIEAVLDLTEPKNVPRPSGFVLPGQTEIPSLRGPTATVSDVRDLRTTIGYMMQDKRAAPKQNRLLLRRLGELQDSVESSLDTIIERIAPSVEGDLVQDYIKANTFYRTEVADKFYRGPVAETFVSGKLGERLKLSPSEIVTTFVTPRVSARADARALKEALGERAVGTFRMAALSDLYKHAYDETAGAVDMTLYRMWIKNHKEALQEFPSVGKELRDTATLSARVDQYRKLLFDPQSTVVVGTAFQRPAEMRTATAELFLKKDPRIAIADVMESRQPLQGMAELKAAVQGDERALDGLRAGMWEHMTREAGLVGPYNNWWENGTSIKDMIVKNHDVLAKSGLFPASHLRRLENIAAGDEILRRSPRQLTPEIHDPISQSLMREAIPAATNRLYAVARHAIGGPYVATLALTSRMSKLVEGISDEKQRKLLEAVIFTPKLSQTFEDIVANRVTAEKGNKMLKAWMLNLGIESRTGSQRKEQEDAQ